jgi:hypothetical protein
MRRTLAMVLSAAVASCSADSKSSDRVSDSVPDRVPDRPSDSLVLEAPNGVTVWFTVARESRDSAGSVCLERALEVRRDTVRAGVPLLYTREAPTLLDSAHMRAVLYSNCRPGPAYRVDFVTVSPYRLPQ